MSDQTKFWIQTLIVPAALATVGYFINNTLQAQQRAFDKIKFAQQVINEAFDSNNPDKALALTTIIPELIEDKAFADQLISLVNNYYLKKAEMALKMANESEYKQISEAAEIFNSDNITISDSLRAKPETTKAEKARDYEQKGLSEIQKGNLEAAQQNFQKADNAYPGFQSSHKISNLLKKKIDDVEQGEDKNVAQQQVLDTIKYSDKLKSRNLKKYNTVSP